MGIWGNVKSDPKPDCWEDGLLPKRLLGVTKWEELFGYLVNVPCVYLALGSAFTIVGTVCSIYGAVSPKVNLGTEASASG